MLYRELRPQDAIEGEPVLVVTKMGNLVARGVYAGFDEGIGAFAVRTIPEDLSGGHGSEGLSYFDVDLYSLAMPDDDEIPPEFVVPVRDRDGVTHLELDLAPPVQECSSAPRAIDCTLQEQDADSPGFGPAPPGPDGGGDGMGQEVQVPKKPSEKTSPSGEIDVDRLPARVRKRLVGIAELDEDQIDRILSDVSEAALRSMKSVGVPSKEIFKKVVEIQDAVRSVLDPSKKKQGKGGGGKKKASAKKKG